MKVGGGFTVTEIGVELDRLPEVPVTVMFAGPVVALALATSVRVLALVALAGLNEAVTPLGKLEAENVTLLLKPFSGVTVTAVVPLVPCVNVKLFGEAESVKLGAATCADRETVSKVAVARAEVLRLETARPM